MNNKPKNAKLIDSDLGHFRVMNFININSSVLTSSSPTINGLNCFFNHYSILIKACSLSIYFDKSC